MVINCQYSRVVLWVYCKLSHCPTAMPNYCSVFGFNVELVYLSIIHCSHQTTAYFIEILLFFVPLKRVLESIDFFLEFAFSVTIF